MKQKQSSRTNWHKKRSRTHREKEIYTVDTTIYKPTRQQRHTKIWRCGRQKERKGQRKRDEQMHKSRGTFTCTRAWAKAQTAPVCVCQCVCMNDEWGCGQYPSVFVQAYKNCFQRLASQLCAGVCTACIGLVWYKEKG